MKKFRLLSLLMLLVGFAACSSDDDPVNLATSAVGTYSGYTVASCAYFSDMSTDGETVKLTSSAVNTVDISFESDSWGDITIDGATLTGTEGNIQISGSGKSVMGMSSSGGTTTEYACTVTGTLKGSDLNLTFSCPAVMGGLNIVFNTGTMPTE